MYVGVFNSSISGSGSDMESRVNSFLHVFDDAYDEILQIFHDNVLRLFLRSDEYKQYKSQKRKNRRRPSSGGFSNALHVAFSPGRRHSSFVDRAPIESV